MNSTPMIPRIAQPWRWLPTMRPNTLVSAAPSAKIEIIWMKFDSAVGFSNGCAALALKKPPPLVPSILIATCDATGAFDQPQTLLGQGTVGGEIDADLPDIDTL